MMPISPAAYLSSETQRIAALRSLGLLDSSPSESFDRITRLAAKILDVPIVLLSLVDGSRQWFKSRYGLETTETSREVSFCAHAVMSRRPLIVGDTTVDARFAANPLVTEYPHIRAYAGVPLFTTVGHAIGTLCVIDQDPREFSAADIDSLTDLANMAQDAIQAIELSVQTEAALQYARDREKLFLDTFELASVGMVHASLAGVFLRTNQHLCELLGFEQHQLDQTSMVDVIHPADLVRTTVAFRKLSSGELNHYSIEARLRHRNGSFPWCRLSVALKRTPDGEPEYLIAVIEDITVQHRMTDNLTRAQAEMAAEMALHTEKLGANNEALREQVKTLLESDLAMQRLDTRLRTITDNLPTMIGYWNRDLQCEFANKAYRSSFGSDAQNCVGKSMHDLLTLETFDAHEPHVAMALAGHAQRFELHVTQRDGTLNFIDVRLVPDRDESNLTRGFYVLATDMTAAHDAQLALDAANAKLASDTTMDHLTGLANGRSLERRGEAAELAYRKYGESYALILLDLNEADAGDDVLCAIGKMLQRQVRSHRDVAARVGATKFGVLCTESPDATAIEQIVRGIESQTGHPPVSVGFTFAVESDGNWKSVYARADAALQAGKVGRSDDRETPPLH